MPSTQWFDPKTNQWSSNASAEKTPETAAKKARIVELRRQRIQWAEIAKDVGLSMRRTQRLYEQALAEVPARHVDEHRAEELMLVDDAIRDLMALATDQFVSPRNRIEAWSTVRAWAERKAKLLGLDAPTQIVTIDRVDQEIKALERELAAMEAAGPAGDDLIDAEQDVDA